MDAKAVVNTGVSAAESVIFSRYSRGEVKDLDISIRFEDMEVSIDIYLSIPSAEDEDAVAHDAALAAQHAIDAAVDDSDRDASTGE